MQRVLLAVCVLLLAESCREAKDRADAGGAAGGMSGTGPFGGNGGSASGGSSGGATAGTGAGGAAGEASGGTGVDAFVDPPADAGSPDSEGNVFDVAPEVGTALEPIRISEGTTEAAAYNDLRFVGVGLEQYEGAVVTFRVGSGSGVWRFGSGQVRIVQGAFDVLFPGVLAPIYEQKLVHIDADGSGACEVGEPTFLDNALVSTDLTLTVKPDDLRFRPIASGLCDMVNAPPP